MPRLSLSPAITHKDIATRCGVSQSAVSNALRGCGHLNPATRARILAVAAELGYDPARQEAARRLIARRHQTAVINRMIAVSIPGDFYEDRYYGLLLHGVAETLMRADFDIVLLHPRQGEEPSFLRSPSFRRGEVDGFLTMAFNEVDEEVTAVQAQTRFATRPVITLIEHCAYCNTVTADDQRGAAAAAAHLLALGHRHLLQIGTWGATSDNRQAGVLQAIREAGLDPGAVYQFCTVAENWLSPDLPPGSASLIRAWPSQEVLPLRTYLARHPQITAMLAANDSTARHIAVHLQTMGKQIPDDYSLIGFDDTVPLLGAKGDNILTSVQVPLREIGQTAAQLIIEQVTSGQVALIHRQLPTRLIVRHTTGPARH
jgi:DNA-binding LacI/PurR family transcriptional regulator